MQYYAKCPDVPLLSDYEQKVEWTEPQEDNYIHIEPGLHTSGCISQSNLPDVNKKGLCNKSDEAQ